MIEFTTTKIKFFEKNFPSKFLFLKSIKNKKEIEKNLLVYNFYYNPKDFVNQVYEYLFSDISNNELRVINLYQSKFILEGNNILIFKETKKQIKDKKKFFLENFYNLSKKIKDFELYKVVKEYYFNPKKKGIEGELYYLNKILIIGKKYLEELLSLKMIIGFLIYFEYTYKFTKLIKYYYLNEINEDKINFLFKNLKWPY